VNYDDRTREPMAPKVLGAPVLAYSVQAFFYLEYHVVSDLEDILIITNQIPLRQIRSSHSPIMARARHDIYSDYRSIVLSFAGEACSLRA